MTIRIQVFLSVLLLFIGVGVFGSAIIRRVEQQAVRQSFDDNARTAAVAFAEFIEPGDVAALQSGRTLDQTRLGNAWTRLQRWDIIKRFYLLDSATGQRLADTSPDDPAPSPDALHGLGGDEVRQLAMRRTSDGHALQPLVTLAQGGRVIAGVEISADAFLAKADSIRNDALLDGVIAAAIGAIIGAILGSLVSRPIRRLSGALDRIGQPEFPEAEMTSPIREIADLGNTLSVMNRVLGETVKKGRLALLESDYYRSERGFADAYRGQLQPPGHRVEAGAEVVWLAVGAHPPAEMTGTLAFGPDAGAAFAGLAGLSSEIVSAVRARAAAAFLSDQLARLPLAQAAGETQALFGLSELSIARWQGSAIDFWRSAPGGEEADASGWKSGAPVSIGCLGPSNRERVSVYLATFADRVGERTLSELPPLLDSSEPGVVLILRRKART